MMIGVGIGASEAEAFQLDFLRKLERRDLAGVRLAISDVHDGI
jgi:transposase-like protein